MIARVSSILLLAVLVICAAPRAVAQTADVGPCFTVRGSLSRYKSAPIVRISETSTTRVLGLRGGVPDFLEEDMEVPGNTVVGEWVVCPLTLPKPGTIQLVRIASANNMVVTPAQ